MMKSYPRVLIISHNPLSDSQNNGKTLKNFFIGWPQDSIAQLYFSQDTPSFSICNNYFQITDLEILKSLLNKSIEVGQIITLNNIEANNKDKEIVSNNWMYQYIKKRFIKRSPSFYYLRDYCWGKKTWNNHKLSSWLDKFNPQIIFFQSSNCPFAFDIVEHIAAIYSAKIIMQTTDDYLMSKFSLNVFFWINLQKLKTKYKLLSQKCILIIPIGDKMKQKYCEMFPGKYYVAMNSVKTNSEIYEKKLNPNNVILFYAGNLGLNRWKVISKIAEALLEIKEEGKYNVSMEIFSLVRPEEKIIKRLSRDHVSVFKGALNNTEVNHKISESDILIHVESFDRQNRYITRYSISTKIPEYFASNRIVFAVGPSDVASIQYIKENNAGYTVSQNSKKAIKKALLELLENDEERHNSITIAHKLAEDRHNEITIRNYLKEFIQNAID